MQVKQNLLVASTNLLIIAQPEIPCLSGVKIVDTSLLKTFLEVNKTRHFAKAAENLFVTSAAVSARIKLLESQLGVQLFARVRGNMQLTSEGERLLPLAENMISTWNRALQEVSMKSEIEARLYIGSTGSLWNLALQEKLAELQEARPEVAIQAEGHSQETLLRLLAEKLLDLIVVTDPQTDPSIRTEKIGQLHLTMGAMDRTDLKHAISDGYVYVDWGTAFSGFHARKLGGSVRPVLHVNLSSIATGIIESRGGAAYLPRTVIEGSKQLKVIDEAPVFVRPIYACYRQQNPQGDLIRELIELMREILI
jgi:DNA-binding transcriptional LysR family regulator